MIAIILGSALLVAGGAWHWLGGTDRPVPTASAAPPAITKSDVDAITTALNSEDPEAVLAGLALAPGQPLDPDLVPGIQALRPIQIDATTLKALDSGTWQAVARVGPGAQSATWTVFLTKADGVWKLAATAPTA